MVAVLKRDQNRHAQRRGRTRPIDFAEYEAARHNIVIKGLTGTVSGKSIAMTVVAIGMGAAVVFFFIYHARPRFWYSPSSLDFHGTELT
jgi:hypothetical protein